MKITFSLLFAVWQDSSSHFTLGWTLQLFFLDSNIHWSYFFSHYLQTGSPQPWFRLKIISYYKIKKPNPSDASMLAPKDGLDCEYKTQTDYNWSICQGPDHSVSGVDNFRKIVWRPEFSQLKVSGNLPESFPSPSPRAAQATPANVKVNITRKYISIKYDDLIIKHGQINSNIINHIWPKNNKINVFLKTLYSDIDNQCHLFATLMCCRHPHIFVYTLFFVHFMHSRSFVKS